MDAVTMAEHSSEPSPDPQSTSEHDATREESSDSHGISFDLPGDTDEARTPPISQRSTSPYRSPIRHHQRTPSRTKDVKETLDAHSSYGSGDDDGGSVHRINQYSIKEEIGRGSFGSVHQAVDQFGTEYAVKEFSKSRLRKRAQSNLLRRPNPRRPGHLGPTGRGISSALHRMSSSEQEGDNNSLSLIKEEIAIMKKLNHNNLVSLIEVLDDPQEDSLYMVLEMCKKGVVMKVGLDERAEPYDDETCRCWFRDMILGIEYLHAQGIIHRDIKPDNCLVNSEDVLKIVDFGVSEMFEKTSNMATAKSAGSPAFMPPELCVAKHGHVSGRAADIWSMGVTLYCLRYGRIPFEKSSMIELYESIRSEEVPLADEKDSTFSDLMQRLLTKDPEKRITMEEIRDHPWVTKDGTDTLLSAEENCADIVEPPTEHEMNHAITGNMGNLLVVMKAARRFKSSMTRRKARLMAMFDRDSRVVAPPGTISPPVDGHDTSDTMFSTKDAQNIQDAGERLDLQPEQVVALALQKEHNDGPGPARQGTRETEAIRKQREEAARHRPPLSSGPSSHRASTFPNATGNQTPDSSGRSRTQINAEDHAKGHAHDPLEDRLFLHIGSDPSSTEAQSSDAPDADQPPIVSESPSAVEGGENIYEDAYREEMDRIVAAQGQQASMFVNRRVEHRDDIRLNNKVIVDAGKAVMGRAADGLSALQTRGSAAHDAGREAARNAYEKLSETDWRGGIDAGKAGAWNVANEQYKSAADRFGPKAERAAGKFSDLVARAQAKAQQSGGGADDDGDGDIEGSGGASQGAGGQASSSSAASLLGGLAGLKGTKSTG